MGRKMLAAVVPAVVLAAMAPGATAAPATFSGTCAITGVSTFDPPLTGSHAITKYDFKSGPPAEGGSDATKCTGTLNGASYDGPAVAKVAGEGDLSCSSGNSTTPGKGSLEFPDGSKFPFDFTFTAIATEVDFVATYGGTETTGHASFLKYAPPTSVFDCSPAGSGLSALGFEATTDEGSEPIKGTKPDSDSGGDGGGGGGNTDSGQAPTGGTQDADANAKKRKACLKKAKKIKNKKKRKKAQKRCRKKYS